MYSVPFKIFFLLLGLTTILSCKKIIAEDISEQFVEVILPKVNDTISTNPVHFKWKELEGTTKYHIEIVQPSFDNISSYVLDSLVTETNFYIGLDSNSYEFRITALNAGYTSKTNIPIKFVVGTSVGSSGNIVVLNLPGNGAYLNANFNGAFSWFALPSTQSYTFELHETNSFAGLTLDYIDQIATNNVSSFNGQSLGEGIFSWGVKAFDQNGVETIFSKRTFYIDTTAPGIAVNSLPSNNSFVISGIQNFSWTTPIDQGTVQSPVNSILQIATDVNFANMLAPIVSSTNTATVNLTAGTYYWRIRLQDEAGNLGQVSTNYFILNVTP